jgi:hypothetical protein
MIPDEAVEAAQTAWLAAVRRTSSDDEAMRAALLAALPLCGVRGWAIMDTDNEELVRVEAVEPDEKWTHSGYCVVPVVICGIEETDHVG